MFLQALCCIFVLSSQSLTFTLLSVCENSENETIYASVIGVSINNISHCVYCIKMCIARNLTTEYELNSALLPASIASTMNRSMSNCYAVMAAETREKRHAIAVKEIAKPKKHAHTKTTTNVIYMSKQTKPKKLRACVYRETSTEIASLCVRVCIYIDICVRGTILHWRGIRCSKQYVRLNWSFAKAIKPDPIAMHIHGKPTYKHTMLCVCVCLRELGCKMYTIKIINR